ncbi:MAG TPA: hypothetical protein DDW85_02235 [Porphyromonadaceae bacterium]|nr:hypothetical protein [Porphyromonadaceae bacterium]
METIKLKKLEIVNFKAIKELTIIFTDKETVLSGANGTGKTTILDAFMWLLFGKDSTGRSDTNFNIKTLNKNGDPILNLDHNVIGVLDVSGREVTLQRTLKEKWGVGKNAGKLLGHTTDFHLNGVKLATKKEYDAEISNIIYEDVFKMVTSPWLFPSLPAETQKDMLFNMAGEISNQDVAKVDKRFIELLNAASGRTLSQYKAELSSKKTAINKELDSLPVRIDEAKRKRPEPQDWKSIKKDLTKTQKDMTDVENQLSDKSKIVEANFQRKSELQKQIGEKKIQRANLENKIRSEANTDRNHAQNSVREYDYTLRNTESSIKMMRQDIINYKEQIAQIDNDLSVLRGQYKTINEEVLDIPAGEFICPTCGRPLEVADIEAKQAEMNQNFNQKKSNRLLSNQKMGKAKASRKKELQDIIDQRNAEVAKLESELESVRLKKSELEKSVPEAKDENALISSNGDWIKLGNEITDLQNQYNQETDVVNDSDLKQKKQDLYFEIEDLKRRLLDEEKIKEIDERIFQLEDMIAKNNQALADLQRMELIYTDFQKAKDNELVKKINGMFKLVSFNFVSEQLNGNEKITCVCTVDGTPYPDVNNAGKINAGLDIINAICRSKGITAPIFIDNAESINQTIETDSQLIKLVVSHYPKLMIKMSGDEPLEMYQEL